MNLNPITALFGVAGKAWGVYHGRKAAAEAGARALQEKEMEVAAAKMEARAAVKIAKMERKAKHVQGTLDADSNYDLQVLKNRQGSVFDEVLIGVFCFVFLVPFVAPFIDAMFRAAACVLGECPPADFSFGFAETIAKGWAAHGYARAPWWFEFAMVGILVSTLGLMRVLRLFIESLKLKLGGRNAPR
ncbi:MAG: hypothetical protein OXU98_05380 [Gammaproteobacteria bacterium]|nr:hypothetical protein [Gammaproteobacteria bacterium]